LAYQSSTANCQGALQRLPRLYAHHANAARVQGADNELRDCPAHRTPETKTRFAQLLAEPVGNTPEQFGAFMKKELARYESVVKASGARVD